MGITTACEEENIQPESYCLCPDYHSIFLVWRDSQLVHIQLLILLNWNYCVKKCCCLYVELPLLKEIRIGIKEKTSFCFLCMEEVAFHDLDSLESLGIGNGCLTYVKKLTLKGNDYCGM